MKAGKPIVSEHSEQVKLVGHIRTFYPDVLIAAVPNGAAVGPLQRVRLVAEGLLPGFPDLIIMEPRPPWHGLLIEMKSQAPHARTSASQKKIHAALAARGYRVLICRGYAEAKMAVLQYLAT